MASYALLGLLSGTRYSAVNKALWFSPKLDIDPFAVFISTASGFGTIRYSRRKISLHIVEGSMAVDCLILTDGTTIRHLDWNVVATPESPAYRELI